MVGGTVHACFKTILSSDGSVHVNNTSLWLVHLPHCEANQVGSLGIDPVAVDRPGGIGDAGSLRIVHVCLIVVWGRERGHLTHKIARQGIVTVIYKYKMTHSHYRR